MAVLLFFFLLFTLLSPAKNSEPQYVVRTYMFLLLCLVLTRLMLTVTRSSVIELLVALSVCAAWLTVMIFMLCS